MLSDVEREQYKVELEKMSQEIGNHNFQSSTFNGQRKKRFTPHKNRNSVASKKLARALMPRQPLSEAVKSDEKERLHPLPPEGERGFGIGGGALLARRDGEVEKTLNFES